MNKEPQPTPYLCKSCGEGYLQMRFAYDEKKNITTKIMSCEKQKCMYERITVVPNKWNKAN